MRQPRLLSPGLMRWLLTLSVAPSRRNGSRTGLAARSHGFTDDEVEIEHTKRITTASEARQSLGDHWYMKVRFTGREVITDKGSTALSTGRRPG